MRVGVDTNLLVRYITQDDARQARLVDAFLGDALGHGTTLCVNGIVLCELAWVLDALYGYSRQEIVSALDALADVEQIEIEARDQVLRAIDDFRRGPGQFADYLIGRRNVAAGCEHTVTFDKKLGTAAIFRVLR